MLHLFLSPAPGMVQGIQKHWANVYQISEYKTTTYPQILVKHQRKKVLYLTFLCGLRVLITYSIIFILLNVEVPVSKPKRSNTQVLYHFQVSRAWQCLHTED